MGVCCQKDCFIWDSHYGQLLLVGLHYADHLGADLLQLLPHVSLQVDWLPHMMAALVHQHANVVTSVANWVKMVHILVAWLSGPSEC